MPEQPSSSDQNETAAGDVLALQAARAYYADTRKEAGSSKI
jgi:hypothetical protein